MTYMQEAEELHKRAINIKSDLLGPCDYEVGLSIGHLASLYSYHMQKYREAERLYLRSIAISEFPCSIDLAFQFQIDYFHFSLFEHSRSKVVW